jgi:RES domain-containing protein
VLAHAETSKLPKDYVIIPVDVPESVQRQIVDTAGLPQNWQKPGNAYCKELGDAWCDAKKALLLDVPSAVLPLERNIIVNPNHPEFKNLDTTHVGYPLRFDSRLLPILEQKTLANT